MFFTTQENHAMSSFRSTLELWTGKIGETIVPFAGRTFVYGVKRFSNINKASFAVLQLVDGVGPVAANKILKKRPFLSIEDAEQKTDIKRRILEQYRY